MITRHADAQRDRNHCLTQQKTIYHPPVKRLARQQWTGAVLEHGVRVRFRREFSSFQTAFRRLVHARKEKAAAGAFFHLRRLASPKSDEGENFGVWLNENPRLKAPAVFKSGWLQKLLSSRCGMAGDSANQALTAKNRLQA